MKRRFVFIGIILLLGVLAVGLNGDSAVAQADAPEAAPVNQIIVKYISAAGLDEAALASAGIQMERLSEAAGLELEYFRAMSGEAHVLRLPSYMAVDEALVITEKLSALPEVKFAEPDYIMFPMYETGNMPAATPNDPMYGNQWHYMAPGGDHYGVDAPAGWDISTGSASVYVAVLDTGSLPHADLAGRWSGGYDMLTDPVRARDGDGRDPDPSDMGDWVVADGCGYTHDARNSSWHGTHVAGTIGAATNNGVGVAGLNWNSKIIPVRVLGRCGGPSSDIADGIRWAAGLTVGSLPVNPNPAQVLNLSLGGYAPNGCPTITQNAVNDAYNAGSAVVVAAGNNNADAGNYSPSSCNNVITVAATDRNGDRAYYSNNGSVVEISGPGGAQGYANDPNGVLSTLNDGTQGPGNDNYIYYQGTSMAAPHVAGVASLLYSVDPSLTPAQVLSNLQNTVTPFPAGSSCNTSICGTGIVNMGNALAALTPSAPNPPVLNKISNPDGDGNYSVSWNSVINADSYLLQEATNSSFTDKTTAYSGAATMTSISGKADGTYYYRVRATNSIGNSGWSNVVSVYVGKITTRYVYLPQISKGFMTVPPPLAGYWTNNPAGLSANNDMEFYVTPDRSNVTKFRIFVYLPGCGSGWWYITSGATNPIVNNVFTDGGALYYDGVFTTPTTANGTLGLDSFYISSCGKSYTGGPFPWSAPWWNTSQPSGVIMVDGVFEADPVPGAEAADPVYEAIP